MNHIKSATNKAETYLYAGIQLAERTEDHYIAGYAWRALGALYLAQGQSTAGERALQKGVDLFEAIALPNEVAKTQEVFNNQRIDSAKAVTSDA